MDIFRVPEGIELRELTELSHLEKLCSVYPLPYWNSIAFFQRMTKHNIHIGAFKSDGTLAAWIFR